MGKVSQWRALARWWYVQAEGYVFQHWKELVFPSKIPSRFETRLTQISYKEYWWVRRHLAKRQTKQIWANLFLAVEQELRRVRDFASAVPRVVRQKALEIQDGFTESDAPANRAEKDASQAATRHTERPDEPARPDPAADSTLGDEAARLRDAAATTASTLASAARAAFASGEVHRAAEGAARETMRSKEMQQGIANVKYLKEQGQRVAAEAAPRSRELVQGFLQGYKKGIADSETAESPIDGLKRALRRIEADDAAERADAAPQKEGKPRDTKQ
ncbi:unnamed protein product [Pedinophyceae sp. YPF-701]|nr:unnamed protein product [Pedinophyceae sp. YPF-701]